MSVTGCVCVVFIMLRALSHDAFGDNGGQLQDVEATGNFFRRGKSSIIHRGEIYGYPYQVASLARYHAVLSRGKPS